MDSQSGIKLAPLVHSRTLRLDFRPKFIAVPEDFDDKKILWARNYVLSSTNSMEFLGDGIRKSIFSDGEHCVIGITCTVKALDTLLPNKIDTAMQYDEHRRPIYVFLGYVYKLEAQAAAFDIPVEQFAKLFEKYVGERWEEKWSDPNAQKPTIDCYRTIDSIRLIDRSGDKISEVDLNLASRDSVFIFPSGSIQDKELWEAALTSIKFDRAFSLCTGVFNINDARKSPFMNVSSCDTPERKVLTRTKTSETTVQAEAFQSKGEHDTPKNEIHASVSGKKPENISLPDKPYWNVGRIVRYCCILGGIGYFVVVRNKELLLSAAIGCAASYSLFKELRDNLKAPQKKVGSADKVKGTYTTRSHSLQADESHKRENEQSANKEAVGYTTDKVINSVRYRYGNIVRDNDDSKANDSEDIFSL